MRSVPLALFVAAVASWSATAQSPAELARSRGELLYATHCIACHTTEVHWREKRLATDWASLLQQVRRWAANAGLGWSDAEVDEVARYLNSTLYRYSAPPGIVLWQRAPVRTGAGARGAAGG